AGRLAPAAPLGASIGHTEPGALGCMTDNDVPLLTLACGKGVVADDDTGPDNVALILRHDTRGDPGIIAGGDQGLPENGTHPHLLSYCSCSFTAFPSIACAAIPGNW